MSARGVAIIAIACASLALSACGEGRGHSKTEQSSAARVSEALDPCAEGGDEFAQQVCQNTTLSSIDTQVRDLLVAESSDISDAGARLLVQNQNRWRDAARVLCGLDAAATPTTEQERCLQGRFRARLQDAQTAVQQVGGYTFQRMELVDAAPVSASLAPTGAEPAPVERNIRFPRIDGRQTPEIRRFNELVAQQPEFRLQDGTSESVDYRIAYAGPEMISVRFDRSIEGATAANVITTINAVTVLMEEGRLLTVGDVFRADSGWEDFITDRAVRALSREFPDYANFPPRRDVYETATKPHLWLVTEQGLTILFPPLSFGGSHADGGAEVSIPWTELRPYLNPGAPAPIRASA
jgi:hypothetical protein